MQFLHCQSPFILLFIKFVLERVEGWVCRRYELEEEGEGCVFGWKRRRKVWRKWQPWQKLEAHRQSLRFELVWVCQEELRGKVSFNWNLTQEVRANTEV